ncbi:heterokaryon incompatibility protein-domain-containing protein [Rhexocercosporidium sp. MPI-PUGE-AT-0058]|nr:heterokaryon incompatibility protein-domain-containing protein [Rhexocercosporidium sp. MPI-PUGE-AT-0058]
MGVEESIEFVRDAIRECTRHIECPTPAPPPTLPTRLLEIREKAVRLIETVNAPQVVKYAALSHCWGEPKEGGPPSFVTSRGNLQEMMENIDYEKLPATFQDAVTVCRALGLKHLWIDSLCIIQGGDKDWMSESGRMCDYYGNAYITISGTCSAESSEHFLGKQVSKHKPVPITFLDADKNGKKVEVCIQRLDADEAAWSVSPGFRSSRTSQAPMSTTKPVASRAWVFQENTLSARVIHFTGLEELGVLYECKHGLRAEKISYTRDLQPWKRWRDLVRDYFPLRLTKECDRLPALSGLADSFARKLPEPKPRYLAGLWKPSLAPDLCWTRELCWRMLRTEGFVSGEYVAPSWSWASVQGDGMAFGADSTSFKPLITSFQDTVVPKSGKNVYGSVSNGSSITMTVPRAELKLTCSVSKDGERTYALSSVIIDAQELWVIPDTVLESWEIPPTNQAEPRYSVRRAQHDFQESFEATVTCIIVGEADGQLHGLLLGISKVDSSAFARLGYFRTYKNGLKLAYETIDEWNKVMKAVDTCRKQFELKKEPLTIF